MAAGLQIWDASGNLIFDTADRITRIINTIYADRTGTGGSYTVPDAVSGSIWYTMQTTGPIGLQPDGSIATQRGVSRSGRTISWSAGALAYIIVGVY